MAKQRKQQNVITVSVRPGIALEAAAYSRAQTAAQAVIDAATSEVVLGALVAKAAAPVAAKATKAAKPVKQAKPAKGTKGKRARVVLDDAKRKLAIQAFKNGATADKVAKDFGVSIATSNNIKRAAGLTKKRKAKR